MGDSKFEDGQGDRRTRELDWGIQWLEISQRHRKTMRTRQDRSEKIDEGAGKLV